MRSLLTEEPSPFIAPLPDQQHQESLLTQIRLLGTSVEELSLVSAHWFYLIETLLDQYQAFMTTLFLDILSQLPDMFWT